MPPLGNGVNRHLLRRGHIMPDPSPQTHPLISKLARIQRLPITSQHRCNHPLQDCSGRGPNRQKR